MHCCPGCTTEIPGDVVINTRLTKGAAKKVEEMNGQVTGWSDKFCDECQGYADQGIILVTIDESKTDDPKNPWRTGGFFVVTEDYIKRLMEDTKVLLERTLEKRMTYIEHELAEQLGLFRHVKNG